MSQKRSENTYQKINTIFKRDANNIIMPYDDLSDPIFEYLRDCKFDCEEKIDGTNIRIELEWNGEDWSVSYKGKTDNAQIPKPLLAYLEFNYPLPKLVAAVGEQTDPIKYTFYGEGYGTGIQSGGYYCKGQKFIGFDIKVNDTYLLRSNRDDIFNKLGCQIVPYIGSFTLEEAIEYVRQGFKSKIAEEEHNAEGLVCRTPLGLKNRRGERIIFKVKTCDWDKYKNKYGTYMPVEQEVNTHYES